MSTQSLVLQKVNSVFRQKEGAGDAKYSRSVLSFAKGGKLFVSFEHSFRINSFYNSPICCTEGDKTNIGKYWNASY